MMRNNRISGMRKPCEFESLSSMRGRVIGRRIVHLESTSSTMDEAMKLALSGEPEGTVVIADNQTSGRGRHGRVWLSPPFSGILSSFILTPRPSFLHEIHIAASLSAFETIRAIVPNRVTIEWPNDVKVDNLKIAGVLCESYTAAEGIFAVVGIGINVNTDESDTLVSLGAVSLSMIMRKYIDRVHVLDKLLWAMEDKRLALIRGETLIPEWRTLLTTLGRRVCCAVCL